MNHVYRVIWSRVLGTWVVVSELARSCSAPRRSVRLLAVPTLLALACAQANATDFYWDGGNANGGTAGPNASGGTGTWNTTLTNWDSAATSGVDSAWVNGDNHAFFPSGGNYTVTLGTPITAGDLTSNGGNVTLTGSTLTLTGTPVLDGSGNLIIASILDGTAGLTKTGEGTLALSGTHAFGNVQLIGGTLGVAAGGTLASANTFVGTGTTLDVHGTFAGTAGDDSFLAAGTVRGALAFGSGNDTVEFLQSTLDGVTLDGGAGEDRLVFRTMSLDAPALASGFERTELREGSTMTLSSPFASGVLAIDASSRLDARAGSRIDGALENAGTVAVGAHRLAISGHYTGVAGSVLDLLVSPGSGTSGGLDIGGNVVGTTGVRFASDGSEPANGNALRIIDSPNDTLGDGGGFVALDADARCAWTVRRGCGRSGRTPRTTTGTCAPRARKWRPKSPRSPCCTRSAGCRCTMPRSACSTASAMRARTTIATAPPTATRARTPNWRPTAAASGWRSPRRKRASRRAAAMPSTATRRACTSAPTP